MDQFWEEHEAGEIHFRDNWQFELKSEFLPVPSLKESEYTQEFFIFIPNALQINPHTYQKEDFFRSQTNLIRLQTPDLTFQELLDPLNEDSPLVKLRLLHPTIHRETSARIAETELKLFANIFRKALRSSVYPLLQNLRKNLNQDEIQKCTLKIENLVAHIYAVQNEFSHLKTTILKQPEGSILIHTFGYIQDVISISINSSLTDLLEAIRRKANPCFSKIDTELSKILLNEKKYREEELKEPDQLEKDAVQNEAILYQSGLLNKFILDALQLKVERHALDEKYRSLIGMLAAGIAGLLYLLLFIWQGAVFVINSLPFVLFSVIIYIIKDRIKDELKSFSFRNVFKWFHDYTTQISLPENKVVIGKMHEAFSFIPGKQIPSDILHLRSQSFHGYLEMIKRPEQVINYKKKVIIYEKALQQHPIKGLNVIFRYAIHNFLAKGSDAYEPYTTIDSETLELIHTWLPKVYHINVILKNTFLEQDLQPKIEYKKYRIVADKDGIKRIENL